MIYTLEYSKRGKPDVVEVKSNVVPLATPKHMEYLAHQMKCIVRDAGGLSVEDYDNGPEAA
jgi:hypothetical protein